MQLVILFFPNIKVNSPPEMRELPLKSPIFPYFWHMQAPLDLSQAYLGAVLEKKYNLFGSATWICSICCLVLANISNFRLQRN